MRRFLFGVVIASMTAVVPSWAIAGDREIASGIMTELQNAKSQGALKGFDLDLKVESGVVYLSGNVRSTAQHDLVVAAVEKTAGVARLVDELKVVEDATKATGAKSSSEPFSLAKAIKQSLGNPFAVVPASTDAVVAQPAATQIPAVQPASGDSLITDTIIGKLQELKQAGLLKGFDLDVSTASGEVSVYGKVASDEQKMLVLDLVRHVRGVRKVIDDVSVPSAVRPASNIVLAAPANAPAGVPVPQPMPVAQAMPVAQPMLQQVAVPQPVPMNRVAPQVPAEVQAGLQPVAGMGSMPMVGNQRMPRPFAPAMVTNAQVVDGSAGVPAAGSAGAPVPMQTTGVPYGMGAPRYDQPYMPSYAWPSYAAYPNYAAVTYPKQYSPSAWPYIGPFYPYPQVPLGWRKVALQWDDGLWYLDFTSK